MRKEDKEWLSILDINIKEIHEVIKTNIIQIKKYLKDLEEGNPVRLSLLNSEVLFLDVNDNYVKANSERDKTGRIIKAFPKTEKPDPEIVVILKAAKQFKKEKNELILELDMVRRKISRKLEQTKKKKRNYRTTKNTSFTIFNTEDPANENKENFEFYIREMLNVNVKMVTKIFLLQRLYLKKLKG